MEFKAALATAGICSISFALQASESMNSSQTKQSPTYVPGEPLKTSPFPAGYNASAAYQCENGWDIFVTGDYLYWAWQQDSLKVAELVPSEEVLGGTEKTIYLNPGYASGFQVGFGFNMSGVDNWNLYSEYTWYRNRESKTVANDESHLFKAVTPIEGTTYFYDGILTSKARMHFDALDLLLKRPFYFGRKLTANFGAGLTALWITQKFTSVIDALRSATDNFEISEDLSVTIIQKQTSWGLGPKLGFESNWMLGCGFKIMANLSTSLLYTRYELKAPVSGSVDAEPFSIAVDDLKKYSTIRPITEAFLGMGWDMGLYDDEFRIGFSAGYDFNVYWDYSMKTYVKNNNAGNIYLQGLNVGARFDF